MKQESYNTPQELSKTKIIFNWIEIIFRPLSWMAIGFFFIVLSFLLLKAKNVPDGITDTITQVNILVTNLNKKEGTMFLLNKDALNLRVAIDNLNSAAIDERIYFEQTMPTITTNINSILSNSSQLVSDTNKTVNQNIPSQITTITQPLSDTVKSANAEIIRLQATTDATTILVKQAQITLADANKIVTNPNVTDAVKNADQLLKNSDHITNQINKTIYNWRHPFKSFGGWIKHLF